MSLWLAEAPKTFRARPPARHPRTTASLGQPVFPGEGQENRDAHLCLNVVGQAGVAVPSARILSERLLVAGGRIEACGHDLILELVDEDVVADLEHGREPA